MVASQQIMFMQERLDRCEEQSFVSGPLKENSQALSWSVHEDRASVELFPELQQRLLGGGAKKLLQIVSCHLL